MLTPITSQIETATGRYAQEFWNLAVFLHTHPEIGLQEFQAVEQLTGLLESHGFTVEHGIAGLPTAFRATYAAGGASAPTVAFIAEYDALPDIGHACGHNLIAAMSAGAGIVLSQVQPVLPGQIVVLGTPAEEGLGGKITMVRQGVFAEIDAALMIHPHDCDMKRRWNLAACMIDVEFRGKAAHAASNPHDGVNALDAMLLLFQQIGLLRQQVTADVRIHGIITHGGAVANVIPEYTRAEFIVRASELQRLHTMVDRFTQCVKGAALSTGTRDTISIHQDAVYEPLLTNNVLMELFAEKMRLLDVEMDEQDPFEFGGSSDIGNVSQVVPTIHPYGNIAAPGQTLIGHSREFAQAAISESGRLGMIRGIQALAMCGADLFAHPEILAAAKAEFKQAPR